MAELLHNLALLITIWQMPLLFPDNAVKMQKVPLGAAIEKKRREIIMKKKLLAVLLTGAMVMSMLTACGGGSEETSTDTAAEEVVEEEDTAEDSAADGMCSDETFSALQDNYASMVEAYNAVKDLYESDEIEADDSIEDVMNQAADVINEMGEISQDTITEEDAETLNSAMLDILDALSLLVDGMTETDASADAASEGCSDESFATLQDNFAALSEAYDAVSDAYMSDEVEQNDDIEAALNETQDIMTQMGEISQDTITEEDAEVLNDSILALLEVLDSVVDAM